MHKRVVLVVSFLWLGVLAAAVAAWAQSGERPLFDRGQVSDLSSLDLEALLNTRIITASRFSEQESDAPGVISVVSRDEMRRFGGTTLRDVLERVPGLTGTTAYFTDRSMVAARGDQTKIDGGHILLLINGRPTREILEGGMISDVLESFPIDALDHIEVVRGPGSVLYGSNAFSAVVNLITKDVQDRGFTLSGAGGAGGALSTLGNRQHDLRRPACAGLGAAPRPAAMADGVPDPALDWSAIRLRPRCRSCSRSRSTTGHRRFFDVGYKGFSVMTALSGFETSSFVRGSVSDNHWGRLFTDVGYAFHPQAGLELERQPDVHADDARCARDSRSSIGRAHEAILEWTNSLKLRDTTQVSFGALFNHIEGDEIYEGIQPAITISEGSRPGGARSTVRSRSSSGSG